MNPAKIEPVEYATAGDGVTILSGQRHKERQNERAVLFVHGLTGNPRSTWSSLSGVKFADLIISDPELADFDVFTFGYRTTFVSGSRIENAALQLADEIHGSLKNYQIVLIAHSLGGLVCMQYVIDRLSRNRPLPIIGLLLYGTPTTGTDLVKLAAILGFALQFTAVGPLSKAFGFFLKNHRQLQQLSSASDFLSSLHDQWALRCVNGGDPNLQSDARAWLPVRVVTAERDFFVSEVSAKSFYGQVDWHPLAFSHTGLVKPESSSDVRFQRAKDFLETCRRTKEGTVLNQIWRASQDVWNYHRGRLIKDWHYTVDLHTPLGKPLSSDFANAGFSRSLVRSSYSTILEQPYVRIGVSLGQIATKQLWQKMVDVNSGGARPAYVHGLHVAALPEAERKRISNALVDILSGKDLQTSWDTLFAEIDVQIVGEKLSSTLVGGEISKESSALVRTFNLPENAGPLVGEEVELKLSYQSIIPKTLQLFRASFPWVTQRCVGELAVHGDMEFFTWTSYLVGEQKFDTTSEEQGSVAKLLFQSDGVLLPGTRVELLWQLKAGDKLAELTERRQTSLD